MLSDTDKNRFELLRGAFKNGNAALVECTRRGDKRPVAVVCATGETPEGDFTLEPLGLVVDDELFETLEPPTTKPEEF